MLLKNGNFMRLRFFLQIHSLLERTFVFYRFTISVDNAKHFH